MPPSDLINVRNFRDKYAGLVRSQKDRGLLNAQAEWPEEVQQEVAARCQIADDLSFSNAAFVNPTLFHMLRQHREFNDETEREWLQRKRDVAAEQERHRKEKLDEIQNAYATSIENQQKQQVQNLDENGHALASENFASTDQDEQHDEVEAIVAGDSAGDDEPLDANMLLRVDVAGNDAELGDQTMDVDRDTVEDALARLANDNSRTVSAFNAQEVFSPAIEGGTNGFLGDTHVEASAHTEPTQGENGNAKASASDSDDDDEVGSSFDDRSDVISSSEDDRGKLPEKGKALATPIGFSTRKPVEVAIRTPQSDLPEGITHEMLRKAMASSGFVRSTEITEDPKREVKQRIRVVEPTGVSELESKFRTVKRLLDESTLASLREANRRMVPPRYRLEVNFLSNRVQPEHVPNLTPVADDEVILSVCFYNTRSSNSKMEEYLVLGSQSLTVLRDAFYCISDFLVSHRDEVIENTKDRKVSSSYFFIEKTFYNDMRSPTATDYSRVLTEWANDPERQEKNPKMRGLQSRLMDGARFLDLSIRLKQPYTFVHQGDCEHVMMFTDLRLLGPKDDQFVESYPKQIFRTRHMRHKCRMCSAYPAQFVTKNDFHSGMSPCYFCEKCYTPFHFGTNGEKLLEHDVFPYANVNLM
ncbi:hypothetical protein EV174_002474 [Coemansia sp. RSA 2320]|nr:hypothetical protein EV174_002474 [Coemansia sp. RSA 2320]